MQLVEMEKHFNALEEFESSMQKLKDMTTPKFGPSLYKHLKIKEIYPKFVKKAPSKGKFACARI